MCSQSFGELGWHHRGPSQQLCFYLRSIQVVFLFIFIYLIRGMTVHCMRQVSLYFCFPFTLLSTCSSRKGIIAMQIFNSQNFLYKSERFSTAFQGGSLLLAAHIMTKKVKLPRQSELFLNLYVGCVCVCISVCVSLCLCMYMCTSGELGESDCCFQTGT